MPLNRESQTTFPQDGTKASLIAVPNGSEATVTSTGADLFYGTDALVTSDENDGKVKDGESTTFKGSTYVVTAQNQSTSVFVYVPETLVLEDARKGPKTDKPKAKADKPKAEKSKADKPKADKAKAEPKADKPRFRPEPKSKAGSSK